MREKANPPLTEMNRGEKARLFLGCLLGLLAGIALGLLFCSMFTMGAR